MKEKMKKITLEITLEIKKILFVVLMIAVPLVIVSVLFGQREHVDRTFYFDSREQAYAKVADLAKDNPSAHIYNETVELKTDHKYRLVSYHYTFSFTNIRTGLEKYKVQRIK